MSPCDGLPPGAEAPGAELRGPYGPNTPLVSEFHKRLGALVLEDLGSIARRWRATVGHAWLVAEDAANAEVYVTDRSAQRAAALETLFEVFDRWRPSVQGAQHTVVYVTAQYVATMALVALLLRDQLAARYFETLYDPFALLIPFAELEGAPRADLQAGRVGLRPRGHAGREHGHPR